MRGRGRFALFMLIAVLVILHFLLRIGLGLGDLAPDLLVLALLLAAREMRAGAAAGLGLALALFEGAVVPYALGGLAITFTVVAYLASRTRDWFGSDNLVLLATYLFAGKWLADAMMYSIALLGGAAPPAGGFSTLLFVSPLAALYLAVAGLFVASFYRALT